MVQKLYNLFSCVYNNHTESDTTDKCYFSLTRCLILFVLLINNDYNIRKLAQLTIIHNCLQ